MSGLGFEQKIEGLQGYHAHLGEINPGNPDHLEIADPAIFYGSGFAQSQAIQEAQRRTIFDIECHGNREYYNRGLQTKDLREDSEELRHERADLLAVMTGPLTTEVREERTERISVVLAEIVSGQTLSLVEFDTFHRGYKEAVEVVADPKQPLFAVFRNGYIASRDLTVQYEPRLNASARDPKEKVATFDVTELFRPKNPLILERAEAKAA